MAFLGTILMVLLCVGALVVIVVSLGLPLYRWLKERDWPRR